MSKGVRPRASFIVTIDELRASLQQKGSHPAWKLTADKVKVKGGTSGLFPGRAAHHRHTSTRDTRLFPCMLHPWMRTTVTVE